nr:hypothetical protein [Myxococcales bacterium]
MARRRSFRMSDIGVYELRRDGEKTYWQVRRSLDGVRETLWIGWATREEVEDIVAGILATTRTRALPNRPGNVAGLLMAWLRAEVEPRGDIRDRTKQVYNADARHLVGHLGTRRASTLTEDMLVEYRDARLAEGGAPGTVKQELKRIVSAWRWARRNNLVPDRPLTLPKLRVSPV